MWNRTAALVRHDLRVLRRDPAFIIIMTAMPLVMMTFLKNTFKLSLQASGYADATGAEQIVPGGILMFSSFLMGNLAFSVFREHGYRTWDRLRASPASTTELLLGKSVVPFLLLAVQSVVLFGFGVTVFGLRVRGSLLGVVLVAFAHWLCLVSIGLLMLAVCRSIQQVNAATNVGAMVLAGLGGAFAPLDSLPKWAQRLAPITPHYWAMRGFRSTILQGRGVASVIPSVVVLMCAAIVLAVIARLRFRVDERKLDWA